MDNGLIANARGVLDMCLKKGQSAGEVYLIESKKIHLEVEKSEIDVIKNSVDRLMAVRTLSGHSLGFAYCTDFSKSSLDLLIEQVINSALNTDEDAHYLFPPPEHSNISSRIDDKLLTTDIKEKFRKCQEMEKIAYKTDPRVRAARQISYSETISDVYLINSNGLEVSYSKSACSSFAMVVAREGEDAQMAWDMDIQTEYDRLKWTEVSQEAARKAVALLGAKPISTRKAPVIFSPAVSVSIIGAFAPAFLADAVQKGRSLMAGRMGKTIASPLVTLLDNGILSDGLATAPYDGEGVPMQKTIVIENGKLSAFLYDSYTAHKDGVTSTGNGVRSGPKSPPQVGATNMYIENGSCSEDQLLIDIQEGLYVCEIMGAHTINPISGDYSLGATGHWVQKGKKAYPVRGVTISGNMIDLLKNISGCANNLRFYGHYGSPTVAVSEMVIAGED
ncbi:MAG: TldD/PmbA family protein [bacterium]